MVPGAWTFEQLWIDTPSGRLDALLLDAAAIERARQNPTILMAAILFKHPMIGGMKDLDPDDLYSGVAAIGLRIDSLPSDAVLGGVLLAFDVGWMSTDAVTLLNREKPKFLAWLRKQYQ